MVKDLKLRRIPASFRYAARGLWHVLRTEQNMQIHAVAATVVVVLALVYQISSWDLALLVLAMGLVITAEVLNTVVEDFLDLLHPSQHAAVRRIKDALAGAVLLSALVAVVVGILVFWPYVVAGFSEGRL